MPRKEAYVCSLTITHVDRIYGVLDFMTKCNIETERRSAAATIKLILRSPMARRSIRPQVKEIRKAVRS